MIEMVLAVLLVPSVAYIIYARSEIKRLKIQLTVERKKIEALKIRVIGERPLRKKMQNG